MYSSQDLFKILSLLYKNKLLFKLFAGGSNVVFPDKGIAGFLIHLKSGLVSRKKNLIIADAGVSLTSVLTLCVKKGLSGLEKLSGIPGSVGGAVVGNAGVYGSSVSDCILKVKVWRKGKIYWISNKDCHFQYRDSIFKHLPFFLLQVVFKLVKTDKNKLKQISEEIIKIRLLKYKPGLKCPGSFFKNVLVTDVAPEAVSNINQSVILGGKIPAGFLLTAVGARGMKIGGIEVSDFHGNLLINNAHKGTAEDVKKLALILKKKVLDKFGIHLEEEVRYV